MYNDYTIHELNRIKIEKYVKEGQEEQLYKRLGIERRNPLAQIVQSISDFFISIRRQLNKPTQEQGSANQLSSQPCC